MKLFDTVSKTTRFVADSTLFTVALSANVAIDTGLIAMAVDWAFDCNNRALIPEAMKNLVMGTALVGIVSAATARVCNRNLSTVFILATCLACLGLVAKAFHELELDTCVMEKSGYRYTP